MDRMRAYREFVFTLAQAVTIEEAAEMDIFVSKALVPTQENARYECDDAELEICSLEPGVHIGTEGIFVSDPEDYAELRNKTTFIVWRRRQTG